MSQPQITLYTHVTPNGQKVSIVLEILGIPYKAQKVDIFKGEQKEDWFLKINPNGRIPAIVDHANNDFAVFESGAILLYLVQKYDPEHKLWPKDEKLQSEVVQWLMFQMGEVGPMAGQAAHFAAFASEKIQYGIDKYMNETKRLFSVLDNRLQGRKYLVADQLTISDLAIFPWIVIAFRLAINIQEFLNLKDWAERIDQNPKVAKGLDVPNQDEFRLIRKDPEALKKSLAEHHQFFLWPMIGMTV